MNPIRLLIVGCLLYIIYRLLTGGGKEPRMTGGGNTSVDADGPVQDVLVEDPVCHKYIPRGQAVQLFLDKKPHYFCSSECSKVFLRERDD